MRKCTGDLFKMKSKPKYKTGEFFENKTSGEIIEILDYEGYTDVMFAPQPPDHYYKVKTIYKGTRSYAYFKTTESTIEVAYEKISKLKARLLKQNEK